LQVADAAQRLVGDVLTIDGHLSAIEHEHVVDLA
jgi:hypothetical protein